MSSPAIQNYHIFGPDHFRAKEYIRNLQKDLGLSVEIYSFPNEVERALANLSQQSLFGKMALIVFRDNQDMLTASLDKLLKSSRAWIIWETSDKSKFSTDVNNKLSKICQTVEMPLLSDQMVNDWIKRMATQYKLNLTRAEILYIQESTGSDLNLIQGELQKIYWLSNGKDINDRLSLLCSNGQPVSIFPLLDAISVKNKKVFMEVYQNSVQQGIDEWQLFFALARMIQNLYQAKIHALSGLPQFVVSKIHGQSQHWTKDELIEFASSLSEYEYDVKIGNRPDIMPALLFEITKRVCSHEI